MASVLKEDYFQNEASAFERLEAIVWPNGPICPHCKNNGDKGHIGCLDGVKDKKGRVRLGLKKCYACRGQFTVRKGTVFEDSPIPLTLWFQGAYLMCSSKKGVSANQLHRTLGVALQTAWFMGHRLREAMRTGGLAPMGGAGSIIEIDETFIGRKEGVEKAKAGYGHKNAVLSLVERGGSVRSFHVDSTRKEDVLPIIRANIARETHVMTDEANQYAQLGEDFVKHDSVDHHREEYAYRDRLTGTLIGTNTVEGFYSIFKRGMKGVYQHCSEKHLHRYVAEFDFRYSNRVARGVNDGARTERALRGIFGKRLTYREPLGK
ncbi:MAG: IS1595 family transposase [Roseiarcus sp.]